MIAVDVNADLAEGELLTASDTAVPETVTSVSIACGSCAGNRVLMRTASALR